MCGIFFYKGIKIKTKNLYELFMNINHRGPDESRWEIKEDMCIGFHRLAINGLNYDSSQPFHINNTTLICNGEIYNYKELVQKHNIKLISNSDCEIISHLYLIGGEELVFQEIIGEFALILIDHTKNKIIYGRDPLGIRSLYYSHNDKEIYLCSELKGFDFSIKNVNHVIPGTYSVNGIITQYYKLPEINYDFKLDTIKELFLKVVQDRLMSDRSIGCILSGGLDSSLVTSIVAKSSKKKINTYTIGLTGSPDLEYAKKVADYLGTNHHELIVTESEFLDAIGETIYIIESYDVTTVRASVGNYLISKYIQKLNLDTVVFCGDVSDEIFGSYKGLQNAPNKEEFYKENVKLVNNICYFDVLRSDKSISGASLEARVPFGDIRFVDYIMSIPPEEKMFNSNKIEKKILRDQFIGYLPNDVLYRKKEAFSDGVSKKERSWYQIIQEYVDKIYTDEEFLKKKEEFKFNQPYDKESLFYRIIFESYYYKWANTIPYFWKQPFSTQKDPSARLLD